MKRACAFARTALRVCSRVAHATLRSMLFLTKDNDFAGEEQAITITEIKEMTAGM